MKNTHRLLAPLAIAAVMALGMVGCSAAADSPSDAEEPSASATPGPPIGAA